MSKRRIPFEEQKPMGRPVRPDPNAKITVILPEVLKEKLTENAQKAQLSLSNYVCKFLMNHFQN